MQRPKKKSLTFALVFTLVVNLSFVITQTTNAAPEAWTSKASMQTARSYPGVAVVNERIYVIGGNALSQLGYGETNKAINTNEEYNPETDTWNYKEPMPTSRYQFATVTYENKVYCIGGKTNEGVTGVNEVYDPSTDTWENRSSMPTPRMKIQANLVDEKIYIISTGVTEVYDPKTDTWTTKTPTSNRITSAASAVTDDKIFFLATPDCSLDLGAFIQVYYTKNDSWSRAGPAPTYGESATTAPTAAGSGESKKIVFFQYSSTLIYYPTNDSWARGTTISNSRGYVGIALLNDVYYVIGGIQLPFNPFGATRSVGTNAQYNPNENIPLEADTTIYIRSDGRIEPSTANITTPDNVTYTFTDNNYERMIIERDNILIDGNGHTLQGASGPYTNKQMSYGIVLYQRQNVTITNTTIIGFATAGIGLQASTNNSIIGSNTRTEMNDGVRLYSGASNNTFKNNVISSIAIYEGATGNVISSNHLANIISYGGSGSIITENYMKHRGTGIFCLTSSNNTIINNYINCDQQGIILRDNSDHNKISNNTLSSISIENSNNNSIYCNNFVGNKSAYTDENLNNVWDNGITGNYWINYNGTDNNEDLIGDTPYTINENNTDNYPIMAPITVFDAGTWEWTKYYVDVVSNATVFDFVFDPEQDKISFRVTTENETTGFCKVTIPKDLLDVENNNWLVFSSDDAIENLTTKEDTNNTYLYFNYDNQTELVEIIGTNAIPEFQQWTIPAVFMATALVTVMFYKRIQKNQK